MEKGVLGMGYNNDVDRIDTTTSRFESFVKSGMLYVDKSMYAYSLLSAEEPSVFRFIARPRRFGKSLFVSMLEAALEGKRELFDGLYLGSSDYDFHPYPVIHLDMSMLTVTDGADVFRRSLTGHIWDAAKKYDLPIESL